MDPDRRELLDMTVTAMVRAIDFDAEIVNDHLKYSSWLGAVALGGIAAIGPRFGEIVKNSALTGYAARATIITGVAVLLTSVAAAAFLTWKANQQLSTKREQKTLLIKQLIKVRCEPDESSDALTFAQRILQAEYLNADDRKAFEERDAKEKRYPKQDRLILVQQILTGVGYIALFAPTIPFLK